MSDLQSVKEDKEDVIVGSLLVGSWMTLQGITKLGFLELNLQLWRGKIQI